MALALAATVAGCGKSALQRFGDDLRPLDSRAAAQKAQIAATLRTARLGSRRDAAALRAEIRALAATETSIARLHGPSEVRPLLARYAHAAAGEVAVLNRFAAAMAARKGAALPALGQQVQSAEGAVRRADDALHNAIDAD